jgi:hypothetical protein
VNVKVYGLTLNSLVRCPAMVIGFEYLKAEPPISTKHPDLLAVRRATSTARPQGTR